MAKVAINQPQCCNGLPAVEDKLRAHTGGSVCVDLEREHTPEVIGAIDGRRKFARACVETGLIVRIEVVDRDLYPCACRTIIVKVGDALEAGQLRLFDNAVRTVDNQPVM